MKKVFHLSMGSPIKTWVFTAKRFVCLVYILVVSQEEYLLSLNLLQSKTFWGISGCCFIHWVHCIAIATMEEMMDTFLSTSIAVTLWIGRVALLGSFKQISYLPAYRHANAKLKQLLSMVHSLPHHCSRYGTYTKYQGCLVSRLGYPFL